MLKVIIFVAVTCLASLVAGGRGSGGYHQSTPTPPCNNITNVQTFLSNYQTLLQQLAVNSSFTQWLQIHAQEVAYINGSTTDAIGVNCTSFFTGLYTARSADKTIQKQNAKFLSCADNSVRKLSPPGVQPPSSDNSGEHFRLKRLVPVAH